MTVMVTVNHLIVVIQTHIIRKLIFPLNKIKSHIEAITVYDHNLGERERESLSLSRTIKRDKLAKISNL